jgi:hypothetical protein
MRFGLVLCCCFLASSLSAQFGVAFHQSNLPFLGFNYEFKERFRPELRLSVDRYVEELPVELAAFYDVLETPDYEVYAGLGYRVNLIDGPVLPVGLNVYPFSTKNLGFHVELAFLISEDDTVLRGSWGIRYRFRKPGGE